mmetsp:Transcript_21576/g.39467  ORF Transcript_21576/g.39467 Transcript_21576/m.39467 type:complete len:352 (-) Transcript_21576:28-1083(-)
MARLRPEVAYSTGGLVLRDEENTRSVVMEIIKSLGRKLMSGSIMDIMRVSRPASISYPMTYLQAAVRDFSFLHLLYRAAEATDPVTRLQLVLAFVAGGLHINPMICKNKPPLNPILGETYAASMPDGSQIYLEQTSHHPPITHWELISNNGQFRFTGHGQLVAGLSGPNTLYASKKGRNVISFFDGTVIEYDAPSMEISGLVMGERIVNYVGKFNVTDITHQLVCECEFVTKKGMIGSLTSWFKSKTTHPTDFFNIVIRQYSEQNEHEVVLARGLGSWLEYVAFNDNRLWTIKDPITADWTPHEVSQRLPSDSSFRPDLKYLRQGNLKQAQIEKDALEDVQRADKVLRGHR